MRREEQAATWRQRAGSARDRGDDAAEIECLRHAAALYTVHDEEESTDDRAHAEVCHWLADRLFDLGRLPEAMQTYQEAADAYGRLPDAEAQARECARRIRAGVIALRDRPQERLYLLIARHEREQRQLAEEPGTQADQGDCAFRIATILDRRERYREALARYEEALNLYRAAADTGLRQATSHHRLGDLYDRLVMDDVRAFAHYEAAVRLYAEWEPPVDGRQANRLLCEQRLRELATDIDSVN